MLGIPRQADIAGPVAIQSGTLDSCSSCSCCLHACRCGFWGDATRECRCTPGQIQQYLGKISGPLLDRIDIHVEVPAVPYQELRGNSTGECLYAR